MDQKKFSKAISLRSIQVTDSFWKKEMELVRKEVIPYQWAALNDAVDGAAPSYCMRNFRIAGQMNQEKAQKGESYTEPSYTFRGFEALPEDPNDLKDMFYGFVFQDSDFSKWIEAVGYSLTQHPDPELEQLADGAIDIVCAAQQEDGYLDTYYIINGKDKIFSNLKDHHELYCFGHLLEGAIAYFEATGKDKLLNAAKRFADYIDLRFGPEEEKSKGYPGHEIAEMALVRLYELSGEEKYLRLSSFFVEQRGQRPYYFDQEDHPNENGKKDPNGLRYEYYQAHKPVREQEEATGHAVRALYLYSGMADLARTTQDKSMLAACERLWSDVVDKKMYITGGVGSTHHGEAFTFAYDLPNDTVYAETCASIGLVFFARRMLEIKADARYADVMERALYNGVLSGMALDGKSFFYVNPLEVNPIACQRDGGKRHVKAVRQKWFGCACCPPNVARLLSSIGSYAYTENEDTLYAHLYIGGSISKAMEAKEVKVSIESAMPWSGEVSVKVMAKGTKFKLALRIPGWSKGYQLENAAKYQMSEENGYLYLHKEWEEEDTIHINFTMEANWIVSHPAVRENIGKLALARGPLVYCLEEVDNGKDLYQIRVNPEEKIEESQGIIGGMNLCTLHTKGLRNVAAGEKFESFEVFSKTKGTLKAQEVRLNYIPYFTWANRGENEMQVWTKF